jgi:hypothetical protein
VVSICNVGAAKVAQEGIELPQQAVFQGGGAKDPASFGRGECSSNPTVLAFIAIASGLCHNDYCRLAGPRSCWKAAKSGGWPQWGTSDNSSEVPLERLLAVHLEGAQPYQES